MLLHIIRGTEDEGPHHRGKNNKRAIPRRVVQRRAAYQNTASLSILDDEGNRIGEL